MEVAHGAILFHPSPLWTRLSLRVTWTLESPNAVKTPTPLEIFKLQTLQGAKYVVLFDSKGTYRVRL